MKLRLTVSPFSGQSRFFSYSKAWQKQYKYLVAASYAPKLRKATKRAHGLPPIYASTRKAGEVLFMAEDLPNMGDDCFFCARMSGVEGLTMGVADGVGSWRNQGVDPSRMSHGLCLELANTCFQAKHTSPVTILVTSFSRLVESRRISAGSTTICVATITPSGRLRVANLGDSGYLIFREGRVLFASPLQQHHFNAPYQLTAIAPEILEKLEAYGGKKFSDQPSDADVTNHDLRHGDVLLFITDGLSDNVYSHDTLSIVNEILVDEGAWIMGDHGIHASLHLQGAERLAEAIVQRAVRASLNHRQDGPWAKELQRQVGEHIYSGGYVSFSLMTKAKANLTISQ